MCLCRTSATQTPLLSLSTFLSPVNTWAGQASTYHNLSTWLRANQMSKYGHSYPIACVIESLCCSSCTTASTSIRSEACTIHHFTQTKLDSGFTGGTDRRWEIMHNHTGYMKGTEHHINKQSMAKTKVPSRQHVSKRRHVTDRDSKRGRAVATGAKCREVCQGSRSRLSLPTTFSSVTLRKRKLGGKRCPTDV